MRRFRIFSALLVLAVCTMFSQNAWAQLPFVKGDVFVSVGYGQVKEFHPNGTLYQTLDNGMGTADFYTTGGVFDTSGNFFVTTFGNNLVSKWDKNGNLIAASWASGFYADCESMSRDEAGNLYVGDADGTHTIYQLHDNGTTGTVTNSWNPTTGPRGTDWIDLQANQTTFFYGSEGSLVRAYDMNAGDLAPLLPELPAQYTGLGLRRMAISSQPRQAYAIASACIQGHIHSIRHTASVAIPYSH